MSDTLLDELLAQPTLCPRLALLQTQGHLDQPTPYALLDEALGRMRVLMDLGHHGWATRLGEALLTATAHAEDHERVRRRARTRQWLGACYAHVGCYERALAVYREAKRDYQLLRTIRPSPGAGGPR